MVALDTYSDVLGALVLFKNCNQRKMKNGRFKIENTALK
jgi:hypothetical protein